MINRLVLENFRHRPVRSILSVLFIGVSVTLLLTIVGLSRGMLESSARRARGVGADVWVRPPGSSVMSVGGPGSSMPEGLISYFEKQPHVTMGTGSVVQGIGGINSISGVDLPKLDRMSGGLRYLAGHGFEGPDDMIVDEDYARQNNIQVGQSLTIINHPWRVVGIMESGKLSRVFVPIRTLQELTGAGRHVSQIFLKLDDTSRAKEVAKTFLSNPQLAEYKIYAIDDLVSLFSVSNVPELRTFLKVVIGLSIVIGFLVVALTMYTAVLERTREIGILKALGASPGYILGIILRETALLAVVGTIAGILMTYGSRFAINTLIPASMTQQVVPDWWPIAGAITLVGALLGALYPGLKAARQDAIEALAYE